MCANKITFSCKMSTATFWAFSLRTTDFNHLKTTIFALFNNWFLSIYQSICIFVDYATKYWWNLLFFWTRKINKYLQDLQVNFAGRFASLYLSTFFTINAIELASKNAQINAKNHYFLLFIIFVAFTPIYTDHHETPFWFWQMTFYFEAALNIWNIR